MTPTTGRALLSARGVAKAFGDEVALHRGVVVGSLLPGGTDLERAFFTMVYAAEGEPLPAELEVPA